MNYNFDASGWLVLPVHGTAREIWVSDSDGVDSNDGLSQSSPKKTVSAGLSLLRDGYPDRIYFKRGDVWYGQNMSLPAGGLDEDYPIVIGSYGSGPRPLFEASAGSFLYTANTQRNHVVISDLMVRQRYNNLATDDVGGFVFLGPCRDIRFENVSVSRSFTGAVIQRFAGDIEDILFNRCMILEQYATGEGHAQGLYLAGIKNIVVRECNFDDNGRYPGPGHTGSTIFRHNMYVQNNCSGVSAFDNYCFRSGATGFSMRSGGIASGNIFNRCPIPLGFAAVTLVQGSLGDTAINNLVQEGININESTLRGWCIAMEDSLSGICSGNLVSLNTSAMDPRGLFFRNASSMTVTDNIQYNWGGTSTGAGCVRIESSINTVFKRNHIQEQNMTSFGEIINKNTAGSIAESSDNIFYKNATDSNNWAVWNGSHVSLSTFLSNAGDSGSYVSAVIYPDPTRTLAKYNAHIGGAESFEAFVEGIRSRDRGNWDTRYDTSTVRQWIMAGWGMTDDLPAAQQVSSTTTETIYLPETYVHLTNRGATAEEYLEIKELITFTHASTVRGSNVDLVFITKKGGIVTVKVSNTGYGIPPAPVEGE